MKCKQFVCTTRDSGAVPHSRQMCDTRRPTGHLLGLLGLVEHDPGGELHDDLVRVGVRLLLLENLDLPLDGDTHPRIATLILN